MKTVLYVRKGLPSISGVARYSSTFERSLAEVASVSTFVVPGDPQRTRTVATTVRTILGVSRLARRTRPDFVWVELSGGALAEFWGALAASIIAQARLVATVHDPPELVGGVLRVVRLDRRPFRRLGVVVDRVGLRLEARLARRFDAVCALSSAGVGSIAERLTLAPERSVRLPAVVSIPQPRSVERAVRVFLPGPIEVAITERVVSTVLERLGHDTLVRVGVSRSAANEEAQSIARLGPNVQLTGFLTDEELTTEYRSANVVVRLWAADDVRWTWPNQFAVSGPVIDALAAGSVPLTNCGRGADEYVAAAGVAVLPRDHEAALLVLSDALDSSELTLARERVTKYCENELSRAALLDVVSRVLWAVGADRPG